VKNHVRKKKRKLRRKDMELIVLHDNVVPEKFWKRYPEVLERGKK